MNDEGRRPMPPDEALMGLANWWFRMVVAGFVSFLAGVAVLIRTMVGSGMAGPSAYVYLALAAVLSLAVMVWLDGVRRRAPRRIQGFLFRMGLYRGDSRE